MSDDVNVLSSIHLSVQGARHYLRRCIACIFLPKDFFWVRSNVISQCRGSTYSTASSWLLPLTPIHQPPTTIVTARPPTAPTTRPPSAALCPMTHCSIPSTTTPGDPSPPYSPRESTTATTTGSAWNGSKTGPRWSRMRSRRRRASPSRCGRAVSRRECSRITWRGISWENCGRTVARWTARRNTTMEEIPRKERIRRSDWLIDWFDCIEWFDEYRDLLAKHRMLDCLIWLKPMNL